MEEIIIIGAGDFAKKVIRLIQKENLFKIIGYTNPVDSGEVFGIRYLGTDSMLDNIISKKLINAAIGIAGNVMIKYKRNKIIDNLNRLKIALPVVKANDSLIEDSVELEEGVIIFNGAFIDFEVKIGKYSVVNLFSLIGHNVNIGSNSVISPKCMIGGGAIIGNNCFVGMHTTVNPYVNISDDVIIGAGSVVTKNITESGTYAGNPAKKIK